MWKLSHSILLIIIVFGLLVISQKKALAVAPTISNPSVSQANAGNNDNTSSQLGATVNPNNLQTYGYFLWGTVDNGCSSLPNRSKHLQNLGSGSSGVSLATSSDPTNSTNPPISGLSPGRTYYYCAVAFNPTGITYGTVNSFVQQGSGCTSSNSINTTTNTDFSVDNTCSFGSTIDGPDKGTGSTNTSVLTIAKGKSLSINSGQTVAYGLIYFPGGSIWKASGGSIVRGSIWIQDGDGDGVADYPDNVDPSMVASAGAVMVSKTAPAGYIRKAAIAVAGVAPAGTIDCAPGNYSKYQYLYGVLDNDGDGVPGDPYVQPTCSGATLPSGYASSVTSADCNDSAVNIYQSVTNLVTDADTDGYKTAGAASTQCAGISVANYNSSGRTYYKDTSGSYSFFDIASALNGGSTDCNDSNQYVYTNQTVATDADQDGYGSSSASSQCAGVSSSFSGRTYYKNASNVSSYIEQASMLGSSDCNDSSNSVWRNGWTDADGDNYATDAIGSPTCLGSSTTGYALSPSGYTDCAPSFSSLNSSCSPGVTTTAASSVGINSAILNGTATAATYTGTGFFRYGTSFTSCAALGSTTSTTGLTTSSTSNPSTSLNISVGSLTGNTTYYYCASATNNWNTSTTTVDIDANKQSFLTIPNAPTGVAATPASGTSMTVTWTNPAGGAASYNVKWCTGASCVPGTSGTQYSTNTGVTSGVTITGLTQIGQTYYFIVTAVNATGSTDSSTASQVLSTVPSITAQGASSITNNSATFTASVNGNGAASTITYRYGTSNSACNALGSTLSGTNSGFTGSVSDSKSSGSIFTGNTTYYYCATSNNSNGTTNGVSNNNTNSSFLTIPNAPTGVSATPASGTSMTVTWTNPAGGAASYNVKWCTGASCVPGASGTQYGTNSGVTSPATITGLTSSGSTYYFIVTAVNATGSTDSGSVSQVLGGAPTVTTGTASSSTDTQEILNSTVNPNYLSTDITYRYGTSNVACSSLPSTLAGPTGLTGGSNLSGVTTQAILTGLTGNTLYYFCVTATNSVNTSYGSVNSFYTIPATPGTPSVSYVQSGNYDSIFWSASGGGTAGTITYNLYYCYDGGNTCTPNSNIFSSTATGTSYSGSCSGYNRYYLYALSSTGLSSAYTSVGSVYHGGANTCYRDNDGDGYGASTYGTMTQCGGCTGGYVASSQDCNDAGGYNYVYQNVSSLYTDVDRDGYSPSASTATQCVGATANYTVFNGQSRTYYNNSSNTYSYTQTVTGTNDCYDAGSPGPGNGGFNANPAQTVYLTSHRGDGSFDYNCNSSTEYQYANDYLTGSNPASTCYVSNFPYCDVTSCMSNVYTDSLSTASCGQYYNQSNLVAQYLSGCSTQLKQMSYVSKYQGCR